MDRFERQAYDLVTGAKAREAFDISLEKPEVREKYGRHSWGQSTLLARRLVEAGTTFVTVHFGGWDHHWDLQAGYNNYLPQDRSARFRPVHRSCRARALRQDAGGALRRVQPHAAHERWRQRRSPPRSMGTPGRDHWGNSMFVLMGGGGVKGGRLIGSTDRLGESPKDHPLLAGDIHRTIFHVLGVDPNLSFLDHAGRPTQAIDHGDVIWDLF